MSVNSEPSRKTNVTQFQTVSALAPLLGLSLMIIAIASLYFETIASMVGIWLKSDTYFHGFLILPISVYLVWRNRLVLRDVKLAVYAPGILVMVALSAAWWICTALGIQVGAHALVVALIPAAVVTGLGVKLGRAIAFPLAYLVFAIPFGQILVPTLMEFTATFTVWALNVTGIPVIREGLYFSIPAGNFEVARACSGIRYLLATMALAALYAYLAFGSIRKRVLFLVLAIIVPIIANALRAYGIVMIAHLSEMRLAVGVDHLIYGWLFFGVVMALLFWIGNKFHDDHVTVGQSPSGGTVATDRAPAASVSKVLPVIGLALLAIALGPALVWRASDMPANGSDSAASIPTVVEKWRYTPFSYPDWRPVFINPTTELLGKYTDGEVVVDLAVVQYRNQLQGSEIVNAKNFIASPDDWQVLADVRTKLPDGRGGFQDLRSVVLRSPVSQRLIWYWYDVNGQTSASNLGVKLLEGKTLLLGKSPVSTLVAVSVQINESEDDARTVLGQFLDTTLPSIERCIREPAATPACARPGQGPTDF